MAKFAIKELDSDKYIS